MFLVFPSPQKCTCSTKMLWQTSRNKNKEKNQIKNKDSKTKFISVCVFSQKCTSSTWTARQLAVPFSWNPLNVLLWRFHATNGCTSFDLDVLLFKCVTFCGILLLAPMCYFCHCQKCSIGKCGLCTKKMENSLASGFLFYWLEQFSMPDM